MALRAAGACVTGPLHHAQGAKGQDALQMRGWRGGWVVAIADGLGSRVHGDVGARLAVMVAQRVAREWAARDWYALPARDVATEIYRRWLAAVPWSDKSLAATTFLLLVCDGAGRARTWQIGDGLLLLCTGDDVRQLTPARNGFGNETRALGINREWSAWHTADFVLDEPGDSVLLMTDGVADDLLPDAFAAFASTVRKQLASKNRRQGRRWLAHELTNWATPMHGDDKTLAVVFRGRR